MSNIQVIGIPIDLSKGTHENTQIKDEKIQPLEIGFTSTNQIIYATHGVWTSEIVDLVDRYHSLDNLATQFILKTGESEFKTFTRTSSDGKNWDDFVQTDETTGRIGSIKRRYIQVKVEFYGELEEAILSDEYFITENSSHRYEDNKYLEVDRGVRLKREHDTTMEIDDMWVRDGHLFRVSVKKDEIKKIDKIRIRQEVEQE